MAKAKAPTDKELLAMASEFTLLDDKHGMSITVRRMAQRDDTILWAVYRGDHWVLSKGGEWEYSPMPSSRSAAFMKRCRFSTLEKAIAAGKKVIANGKRC